MTKAKGHRNGPVTTRKLGEEVTPPTTFPMGPVDMVALRARFHLPVPSANTSTEKSMTLAGRPWHPAMGSPEERDFSSHLVSPKKRKNAGNHWTAGPRPKIAISPYDGGSCAGMVRRYGGEPVVIRGNTPLEVFDNCQGLVIPGGVDVAPSYYNELPHPATQNPNLERDSFEIALVKYAFRHKMAILGICRGNQVLNVAMGGTLVQDIETRHDYKHPVEICPDSLLSFIGEELYVNSLHHQAVNRLGRNMKAIAFAPDGNIEAIQHEKRKYVLGVQWHPEMQLTPRFEREMGQVWRNFITAGKG